jgi:hypothetical protein
MSGPAEQESCNRAAIGRSGMVGLSCRGRLNMVVLRVESAMQWHDLKPPT